MRTWGTDHPRRGRRRGGRSPGRWWRSCPRTLPGSRRAAPRHLAVEVHDRDTAIGDEIEAHEHLPGGLGVTVAQVDRGLDHLLHRLLLVVADDVAGEDLGALAHHCGSRFDGVDADPAPPQL